MRVAGWVATGASGVAVTWDAIGQLDHIIESSTTALAQSPLEPRSGGHRGLLDLHVHNARQQLRAVSRKVGQRSVHRHDVSDQAHHVRMLFETAHNMRHGPSAGAVNPLRPLCVRRPLQVGRADVTLTSLQRDCIVQVPAAAAPALGRRAVLARRTEFTAGDTGPDTPVAKARRRACAQAVLRSRGRCSSRWPGYTARGR